MRKGQERSERDAPGEPGPSAVELARTSKSPPSFSARVRRFPSPRPVLTSGDSWIPMPSSDDLERQVVGNTKAT